MRRRTLMETGEHSEGINATFDGQTIVVTNRFDSTLAPTHAKTLDVVNTIETCDRPRALGAFVQGGMKPFVFGVLLSCLAALPALAAGESWEAVRAQLYGDRALLDGDHVIAIDAPYRTFNDARTDIAAQIIAPNDTEVAKVTVVLDENPMPVSAVFALDQPQESFFFDITLRVNGPTPMHVIAETTDGRIFVTERMLKTSGQGACAAPPGTDPAAALATLGQMDIAVSSDLPGIAGGTLHSLVSRLDRIDVDISHPSHSGMQMDQITLLFIPMRYVEIVEIDIDGAGFLALTGSISLSEDPRIGLSVPRSTQRVDVTMTDTDGSVSTAQKVLPGS